MSINVTKYKIGNFELIPYKDNLNSSVFYGFNTVYSSSASFIHQEDKCLTIYIYENILNNDLSLHIIAGHYNNNSPGYCNIDIYNLPSQSIITVNNQDNSISKISDTHIGGRLNWNSNSTDGFVIDKIQQFNNLVISIDDYYNLNKWKFCSYDDNIEYIDFLSQTQLNIIKSIDVYDTYTYLEPKPGIYREEKNIIVYTSNDVSEIVFTDDGTTPTLAKYLAYDNLTPPNPFIAIVEDGRGCVLFDGGFPKFYNSKCNSSWSTFSDMSSTFKYFGNILNYISNKEKVNNNNKNILVLCDAISSENYNIKSSTSSSSFKFSIDKVCSIMGYTPTYKDRNDYPNGILDATYSELDQYCCVLLFSTKYTNSKLISDACISNLITYRQNNNGILIITDHGENISSLEQAKTGTYSGFFRTANYLAVNYGAYFTGNYNRTSVSVEYLRNTYGDHALWNNISDDEFIYAGGSESKVIITEHEYYTPSELPIFILNENGYITYKLLLKLVNGELVNESYTYGLNEAELVEFLDDNNNIITEIFTGVFNNINLKFNLKPGFLNNLSGLIKQNLKVIGETSHNGYIQTNNFYSGTNNIVVNDGDLITIEINNPLYYSKSLIIRRFQPDIQNEISLSKIISNTKFYEWDTDFSVSEIRNRSAHIKNCLNVVNISTSNSLSLNVKKFKDYLKK